VNVFDLDARRREGLLEGARALTCARGDFIFTAGDAADAVYFVLEGRIKIFRTNAGGGESIVGIRTAGEIFGELAWTTGEPVREAGAAALVASEVRRVDAAEFGRRLRADAVLASAFARGLVRRLTGVERELAELAGKSVPGRLVDVLGRLAADHGIVESDGSVRLDLDLTHKDLADLIGTSRETLTKELGVLADVGLLRVAHRTIVLVQPQAFPFARRREQIVVKPA
jgi:CRP/FNR family transcriptional regulator